MNIPATVCRSLRSLAGLLIVSICLPFVPGTARGQAATSVALYEIGDIVLDKVVIYHDRYTHLLASRDGGGRWKVEAIVATTGFGDGTRVEEIVDGAHLPSLLGGTPDSFPSRYLTEAVRSGALRRTRNAVVEEALRGQGVLGRGMSVEPLHALLDTIDLNKLVVFRFSSEAAEHVTAERKRKDDKFIAALQALQGRMRRMLPDMTESLRFYTKPGGSRNNGPLARLIEDEGLDPHDVAICDSLYLVATGWGRDIAETSGGHFVIMAFSPDTLRIAGLAIIDRYGDTRASVKRMLIEADADAYLHRLGLDAQIHEYLESVNSGSGAGAVKPVEVGLYIQPEFPTSAVFTTYFQRDTKSPEEEEGGGE